MTNNRGLQAVIAVYARKPLSVTASAAVALCTAALLPLHDVVRDRVAPTVAAGFYTNWMDGRTDDPNAGWKGRGLWASVSARAPFHMETGKGTTSKLVHFQLRPDPLAR